MNFLAIIQNNCLKLVCDVYKAIFIAKLKTEAHILVINIYLNELQIKIKQRFQDSKHYERLKKLEEKFIECSKTTHRKSKFISTNSKKTWLKDFNDFIEKQNKQHAEKSKFTKKKLTNHFAKF